MKATFVFPPIPYKFAKTPYPPLGIGYLAAVLRTQGVQVDLIDGQMNEEERFWREVENLTVNVVLISATIRQIKGAELVAKIVKKHNPAATVILVKGEAEDLLPLILRRLEADESLNDVPNLIINKDGNVISTRIDSALPDVRTIPWPDRAIFDEKAYLARWLDSAKMTSVHIMGSRGCPFSCSFCDRTVTGKRVRYRDAEDVAAEMLFLEKRYAPDDIFYFDDLFTVNKKRVIALCQVLREKGLRIPWSAQGRVDTVDEEMLEAMKAAGCAELMFGVESGSERILQFLVKGFTREKIIKAFDLCHRVGIKPGAYLLVGVPGETRQDILDTVSLVERIEPSLLNFSFLTPFPNTALYTATQHWIGDWDYEQWDDFDTTVYTCKFQVDPREARDMILNAYLKKISLGMPYSEYQFANEKKGGAPCPSARQSWMVIRSPKSGSRPRHRRASRRTSRSRKAPTSPKCRPLAQPSSLSESYEDS